MGWSTDLLVNVSFNKKTYDSIYEVEDDLEELNNSIKYNKEELHDLALMTEPEKMLKSDVNDSNIYDTIRQRVRDCLEILEGDIAERTRLQLLYDNWNACHDKETGLAIQWPDNIKYDAAYLEGDFVPTVKNPDVKKYL